MYITIADKRLRLSLASHKRLFMVATNRIHCTDPTRAPCLSESIEHALLGDPAAHSPPTEEDSANMMNMGGVKLIGALLCFATLHAQTCRNLLDAATFNRSRIICPLDRCDEMGSRSY